MYENVTGIVLFGGESKRMGKDKAAIEVGGVSLIRKTINLFKEVFPEVIAISKETGRLGDLGCKEVQDAYPGKGPMVGILTGLEESGTDYIFAAACDMPFINEKVIDLIVSNGIGHDVALPIISGKTDPLHALYSKDCFEKMLHFMENEGRSLNRFIDSLPDGSVKYVSEDEIKSVDPEALSIFNMNTPEELERAKRLISSRNDG